ncbi:MAG TPA: UDP-N-acetylmuramoyl-L-alanine--D-glutamate ligase, partial [Thermoleophilia bacterium]|nr:UDP-N-acetylmuramoyl-L-alanine--D-glutamate ligase [Thermoleophilia bacterium]
MKEGAEAARRHRAGPEPSRGILPAEIERILVLGASRSGVGAAEALVRRGRSVVLSDSKPRDALGDLSALEASGVEVVTGVQGDHLLEGIQLVVKSPGVPGEAPLVRRAREAHIPVWSEVELAFRLFPNVFVAVTGTNGKTTTTAMLGHLLERDGRSMRLVGNIGQAVTSLGANLDPAEELVVEVSSFQLEDVHAFRPAVAVFLNLTPDHLDRHHTMEAYVAAKMKLFARQGPGDVAVVNVGDPYGAALVEQLRAHLPGPRVLTFSLEPQVEVDSWVQDNRLMLLGMPGPGVDELILRGSHNLENALAAGTAALARRADFDLVCAGLRSFPGVPHRLEQAGTVGGISYVNDSKATNVEATLKA